MISSFRIKSLLFKCCHKLLATLKVLICSGFGCLSVWSYLLVGRYDVFRCFWFSCNINNLMIAPENVKWFLRWISCLGSNAVNFIKRCYFVIKIPYKIQKNDPISPEHSSNCVPSHVFYSDLTQIVLLFLRHFPCLDRTFIRGSLSPVGSYEWSES